MFFNTSIAVENEGFCFKVVTGVTFICDYSAKFTLVLPLLLLFMILFYFQDCFLQCSTWLVMLSSQPMLPVEKRGGKCTANLLNMYLDSLQGTPSAAFVIKGAEFHIVCVPFSFCSFKKIFFFNGCRYSGNKTVVHQCDYCETCVSF